MKKIISYLLAVAIIITFFYDGNLLQKVKAEETTKDSYNIVTLEDFSDSNNKNMMSGVYEFYSHKESLAVYQLKDNEKSTFDKMCFATKIKFEYDKNSNLGGWETRIHLGGNHNWKGIAFYTDPTGNSLYVKDLYGNEEGKIQSEIAFTLDNKVAGISSFYGTEFLLEVTFSFFHYNDETQKADLQLGIYINGKLYNQEHFYVKDCNMRNVGTNLELYREHFSSAIYMCSINENVFPTKMPREDLTKATFYHFSIDDKVYKRISNDVVVEGIYKKQSSLDGIVLCGDMFLEGNGENEFQFLIGGSDANRDKIWSGMRLVTKPNGTMELWKPETGEYEYHATLTPEVAGVQFIGEQYRFMMSSQLIDYDNDGLKNDIRVGIWFNDVLYNNSYFLLEDCGDGWGNLFGVYAEAEEEAIHLKSILELTNLPGDDFSKLTFESFGMETGIYSEKQGAISGDVKDFENLDKIAFGGVFRFDEVGEYEITYGGCIRLYVLPEDLLKVVWKQGDTEVLLCTITPKEIGVPSFFKESFSLIISTENVETDIKLKLWFNEYLYLWNEDKYIQLSSANERFKPCFEIVCKTKGNSVYIRDYQPYLKDRYYFEDISIYRTGDEFQAPETPNGYIFSGWYKDKEYQYPISKTTKTGYAWAKFVEEDVLSIKAQVKLEGGKLPDTNTSLRIITTVDSLQYAQVAMEVKNQQGDVFSAKSENTVVYDKLNYRDAKGDLKTYSPSVFSWMSKYFYTYVISGIHSEDYDTRISVRPYWITLDGTKVYGIEKNLCINDYIPTKGTNRSNALELEFLGEDVMPIGGFQGPHRHRYGYGESDYLIPNYNTELYYQMIADAGINLITYADCDYSIVPDFNLQQLEFCEKYGIGVYVNDSGMFAASNKEELLERISIFKKYDSFCGMYIVDEPQNHTIGASNYLYNFEQIADLLRECEVSGYSNLLPVVRQDSSVKNAYKNYVKEYQQVMELGVLSWDFYPFDTYRNGDLSLYFWNMDAVRTEAYEAGETFWAVIQAGSQWNDGQSYFESTTPYYPTRSQFMWNVNTCLAFGVQGIQYFPLIQPIHFAYGADETKWDFERNGIVGAWGNKTQWYRFAHEINGYISKIDHVLMNSYNEGVMVAGQKAIQDTKEVSCIISSYKELRNVVLGNALVGCFDYEGRTAFYVVNYNMYDQNDVSVHTPDKIVLQFDQPCDVRILQKETEEDYTTDTQNQLTLSLEAGEGVLLIVK